MLTKPPYTLIAGEGLGVCYSSLTQLEPIQPSRALGQAGLQLYANVGNGNLIIRDHVLTVMEPSGPLEFSYIYNSQATTPDGFWRLAVISQLLEMPSTVRPLGTEAIMLEADGHITRYGQSPWMDSLYIAPGHGKGRPYLTYDADRRSWKKYHPATHITEYYDDIQGLLRERIDTNGFRVWFEYDNGNLVNVFGHSGNSYQIVRRDNLCAIIQVRGETRLQLQTYVFDHLGRLSETIIPAFKHATKQDYRIQYTYSGDLPYIWKIKQSDTTNCCFFLDKLSKSGRIHRIAWGLDDEGDEVFIDYLNSPKGPKVEISSYGKAKLFLDSQGRFIEVQQDTLPRSMVDEADPQDALPDISQYEYNDDGQVKTIIHPNGGKETFSYDQVYGLLKEHTQPDGLKTAWTYEISSVTPRCTSKTQYLPKADGSASPPLLTRYVHDTNYDPKTFRRSVLRFVISPENRVTEYRVNPGGQIESTRCYLDGYFTSVTKEPIVLELTTWVSTQNPQAITLTEYDYDVRGQVQAIRCYTDIDKDGHGVDNERMSEEIFHRNDAGNWLRRTVRLGQEQEAVVERRYDELERLIGETDELGDETQHSYLDAINQQCTSHTRINGDLRQTHTLVKQFNSRQLVAWQEETVQEKNGLDSSEKTDTRKTSYLFDTKCHPIATTLPDGHIWVNFWDFKNRPILTVSPSCFSTLTIHNRTKGYQYSIQPASAVDLGWGGGYPNDVWTVYMDVLELAKAPDTHYSYAFYDVCERVRYKIDAENYVTESLYDVIGRVIGTVQYADKLSQAELQALKNQQALSRTANANRDRWHSMYYDKEGLLIGEIDPAGWVKAYQRDAGGRITQTIVFSTRVQSDTRNKDFDQIRPEATTSDAITYHFYNAKNHLVCEVNPNGYITTTDYYSNDCVKQTTVFYTPVDATWYQNPSSQPTPVPHPEDAIETFTYNAKGQLLTHEHSNGERIAKQYDSWGQCVAEKTYDQSIVAHPEKSADADYARSHQSQYDGWQQTTRETNAYIGQQMLSIEADGQLSPAEKQAKIAELWQNQSIRRTYDPVSGLLCQVTNSLNHVTRYYYDQERRLTVTIDTLGQVIQDAFNLFGEITSTRHYLNPIPADKLAGLSGGFIDNPVLALLVKSEQDPIEAYTYDKRGSMTSHIDAEDYVRRYQVNAFKEVIAEQLPVEAKEPSLTIFHRFNANGQEIETVHQADNVLARTTQEFDNPYGHVTKQIDAENSVTVFAYDACGNPVRRTDNGVVVYQNQRFDALNRVLNSFDAFQAETQHVYSQATRSHRVNLPVAGCVVVNQTNVFGETLSQTDAKGYQKSFQHEPDGQVKLQRDELGRALVDQHNTEGWHETHLSASGVKTAYHYNALGVLTQTVENSENSASRSTQIGLDTLYRKATITNPLGTVTRNTFDRRGLILTSQIDPDGLKLLVSYQYNGQQQLIAEIHGDSNNPNQYHVIYQKDALARAIGKIIDPATPDSPNGHLALTTLNALDRQGRVVKHTDPKGDVYRLFYDLNGHKRFKVVANGGVQEWRYDAMQRECFHSIYAKAVSVNGQTTLSNLVDATQANQNLSQDKVTYTFRDPNGNVRFRIKLAYEIKVGLTEGGLKGIVQDRQYDGNQREVCQTIYATLIEVDGIDTFTTESLHALMATKADPARDRTVYKFYNPAGDCGFSINAKGQLHEDCFDADKRVTRAIDYATPVTDPHSWLSLPFSEIQTKAKALSNPAKDHYQAHGFDAFGKPLYTVGANGGIIRFTHDANNNLTEEVHFEVPLNEWPGSDDALKAQIVALNPDSNKDRVKRFEFNAVDAQTKIIDPLGKEDVFERDALSNIQTHKNRAQHSRTFQYDRAKRQVLSTSPAKAVTTVSVNANNSLSAETTTRAILTKREYDANNNVVQVTHDYQGNQARSVTNAYTPLNHLSLMTVAGASVDDPSQASGLDWRQMPVVTQNLTKQIRYNPQGLVVVEIDEGQHYRFKVYDNLQRLRFSVCDEGVKQDRVHQCSVKGYEYNAFGDKVWETHYATLVEIDVETVKTEGLSLAWLAGQLQNAETDRVTWYDYNRNSEWLRRETGFIRKADDSRIANTFYFNPYTQKTGTHYRLMTRDINIFGYPKVISSLILTNSEIWQRRRIFYDANNESVLEAVTVRTKIDAPVAFHVKVTQRNAHQEVIGTSDFYTPCTLNLIDPNVTYEQVLSFYQNPQHIKVGQDKIKTYTYTLQGKKRSCTLHNIPWTELNLQDSKNPSVQQKISDATESFDYTPIEKVASHQSANLDREYYFYNAAGELIAHADLPRQLDIGSQDAIVPLKTIGINAHGQAVVNQRFVNGADVTQGVPQATPANPSPQDQSDIHLLDASRGMVIAEQNARGVIKATTFTATKQKARVWHGLSTRIDPKTIVAESAYLWDARGRMMAKIQKENQQVIEATYKRFNAFGEEIAVGPDNVAWPLYRQPDNNGHTWRTNEHKIPTVLLRDLQANITAEMVAQHQDVQQWHFNEIQGLIDNAARSYQDVEITQSFYDENNRLLRTLLPYTVSSIAPTLKNIPLQIVSSLNALSWVVPAISNVDMTFSCWQDPAAVHRLPIRLENGRCQVVVSALATDHYQYRIDYTLKAPNAVASSTAQDGALLYRTEGVVGVMTSILNQQRIVAHVVDDHVLWLAGVGQLTTVALLTGGGDVVGTFDLNFDESSQQYWADIAKVNSGLYTAQATTVSGKVIAIDTGFILNTATAPVTPLAREIPAHSQLLTLNQYGQLLIWESLPKDYQHKKISVAIQYEDQTGTLQQEQFLIDPAAPTTPQQDAAGHEIQANITFKAAVKAIRECDIQLQLHDDTVMLYKQTIPDGSQSPTITHVLHGRQGYVETTTALTHIGCQQQAMQADDWQDGHLHAEEEEKWQSVEDTPVPIRHQFLTDIDHDISDVGHAIDPSQVITWDYRPVRIAWIRGVQQHFDAPPPLRYLDVSADHLATWKDKASLALTQQGIVVDITGFPPGNYPYTLTSDDRAPVYTLTLSYGNTVYASDPRISPAPDPSVRSINYSRDVRGNAIGEVQADGANYDRVFTLDNRLLIETGPEISVQAATGEIDEHFRPVTQRLYDIRGVFYGQQLPEGNIDAYVLNKAGDKLQHVLGDGTRAESYHLDGFGRTIRQTLACGTVFLKVYNATDQLIQYILPNGDVTRNEGKPLVHHFAYNEIDVQDYHQDAAGSLWQIDTDSRANPVTVKSPDEVLTRMTYGRGSLMLSWQNPMYRLQWSLHPEAGYFGVMQSHTDGANSVITYGYNRKWEVVSKQGQGGNHGNMTRIQEETVIQKNHQHRKVLCDMFVPVAVPVPAVNSEWTYIAGRLMSVKDQARQVKTEYVYDAANRPTSVVLNAFDGTAIHTASAIYNALGDEVHIYNDSLFNAAITYDKNRNVRRKVFDVNDPGRGLSSHIDHGYSYDRADRALIIDGAFLPAPQGVVLRPEQGFEVTYVNHQRASESQLLRSGARQTIDYSYWQSGELQSRQVRGSQDITHYYYHPSGYQRLRQDQGGKTEITANAALFQTGETSFTMKSGQLVEQASTSLVPAPDGRNLGSQSTVDNSQPQGRIGYGYQYHYVNFDSSQTAGISGWTEDRYGRVTVSSSVTYDPQGFTNGKWDVADDRPSGESLAPALVWYINGYEGQIYQKWYLYPSKHYQRDTDSTRLYGVKNAYFYSPRGAYLGSYHNQLVSAFGTGKVDANNNYHVASVNGKMVKYANKLQSSRPTPHVDRVLPYLPSGEAEGRKNMYEFLNLRIDGLHGGFYTAETLGRADAFSPVPQVVTVKAGDTYDTIAQAAYGSMADIASCIAEASGESAGMVPQPGRQVVLPQFSLDHYKSNDNMPLSVALQEIIGVLTPHLEFAQPKRSSKWWQQIVRIVIDVIAVYIAGQSGGSLSWLSMALIAAASDLAMQEVAVQVGLLPSVSWQEALATGVATGMGAGFNAPAGTVPPGDSMGANFFPEFFSSTPFPRLLQVMAFAGTQYLLDQMVFIIAGKSQGFSMKGLLEAMVEAGVANQVNPALANQGMPDELIKITLNITNAFVGGAIMGAPSLVESAMQQALGSTFGDALGDVLSPSDSSPAETKNSASTQVSTTQTLANPGPMPDKRYSKALAAAKGKGASNHLTPTSDFDTNQLIFGGLDADPHDFAMAVMNNSNIPVTSTNQQVPRAAANAPVNNLSRWQDLLLGRDLAHPPATGIITPQPGLGGIGGVINAAGNSGFVKGFAAKDIALNMWMTETVGAGLSGLARLEGNPFLANRISAEAQHMSDSLWSNYGLTGNRQQMVQAAPGEALMTLGAMMAGEGALPVMVRSTASLAGLMKSGLFKANPSASSGSLNSNLAIKNHINGLRLQKQFAQEESVAMFKPNGELTEEAIMASDKLLLTIKNPEVREILSSYKGNINDWGKYVSQPIHTESGLARVHFYYNAITKDVSYDLDYKFVFDHQGYWNAPTPKKFSLQNNS